MRYYITYYESPVGKIRLYASEDFLIGLCIERQSFDLKLDDKDLLETKKDLPVFDIITQWLDDYFAGKKPSILGLPIKLTGTKFQMDVWKLLFDIPYGDLVTYNDLAKIIAKQYGYNKMSAQAIGGAVGHNPIPIIVPCHRVIGANKQLVGYGGGIDLKTRLLKIEGIETSDFKWPKNN